MAPSWSTRLPFGSSSNSTRNQSSSSRHEDTQKPLPKAPTRTESQSGGCTNTERPKTSHGTPSHSHSRSASQPLPRLFGRKKSTGNLVSKVGDVPLDESLVPVLDDSPVDSSAPTGRTLSGRKISQYEDQDTSVSRRCMCCDSRVKVPRELDKFRCMTCYTINDVKPLAKQREEHELKQQRDRGQERGPHHARQRVRPPVSVERTKAIIHRCMVAYLESRSRQASRQASQQGETQSRPAGLISRSGSQPEGGLPPPIFQSASYTQSPPITPLMEQDDPIPAHSPLRKKDSPQADRSAQHILPIRPPSRTSSAADAAHSIVRKPVPSQPLRKPPLPPIDIRQSPSKATHPARSAQGDHSAKLSPCPQLDSREAAAQRQYERIKTIFRPLDEYIHSSFGDMATLNKSFSTLRPVPAGRARSESHIQTPPSEPALMDGIMLPGGLDELDAKTLLLGDIGENGSWWTGKLGKQPEDDQARRKRLGSDHRKVVTSRSPNINWTQVSAWYALVHNVGKDWQRHFEALREISMRQVPNIEDENDIQNIENDLAEARHHTVRVLNKVAESLLKRPGRILKEPEDLRWLFILLANPSLYPHTSYMARSLTSFKSQPEEPPPPQPVSSPQPTLTPTTRKARDMSLHSGLVKRIFGLMAHTPDPCHRYVIGWLSRLYEEQFVSMVDLCSTFVTYRLVRKLLPSRHRPAFASGGLIPDLKSQSTAELHSALGLGSSKKRRGDNKDETEWADDWELKGAAKVMYMLFTANNNWQGRRKEYALPRKDSSMSNLAYTSANDSRRPEQLLETSSFYNTMLDYEDLIVDFRVWEKQKDKFAFCQYPLFLSMGAKIKILEYDARRQMEIKAREAIFDLVIRQRVIDGHFNLRIRRECMVEDSLRQISEAVGSDQEELKKGLRVQFTGEEGVDAGGLRKEWFLMLVREVFDAEHGLFVYDEDSHTCYFNPNTFETSDQYYLVGAVLGLAIYNTTILDIALPSFAFRKLLAAAPSASGSSAPSRAPLTYTLADLAEYKPKLAAGLQQLLDFDGDVESTYCWSFVAPVERYGIVNDVPLITNGERIPVTNANRQEFVDAYVKYLLDTAVSRQFEPFKRGFYTVCAGNALSLFRAEEIELLIRGSDEALDVASLRGVAEYNNWRSPLQPHSLMPGNEQPIVEWFWQALEAANSARQRKLLTFITGSDRIPAMGATSLVLRINAGGDGWSGQDSRGNDEAQRFPVARTCFNMLVLWRYTSREQLEEKLWRAVEDSEGFGLK